MPEVDARAAGVPDAAGQLGGAQDACRRRRGPPPARTPARRRTRRAAISSAGRTTLAPARGRPPPRPARGRRARARSGPCRTRRATSRASGAAGVGEQQDAAHASRVPPARRSRLHLLTRDPRSPRRAQPRRCRAASDGSARRGAATGRTPRCPTARAAGSRSPRRTPAAPVPRPRPPPAPPSARSSGSRTTPALADPLLADLELRLDHQHQVAVGPRARRAAASQHQLAAR